MNGLEHVPCAPSAVLEHEYRHDGIMERGSKEEVRRRILKNSYENLGVRRGELE